MAVLRLSLLLVAASVICLQTAAVPAPGEPDPTNFCKDNKPQKLPDDLMEKGPIGTCIKKLGIKKEELAELMKSGGDDKCLAKCIMMERKQIDDKGNVNMANVEADMKKYVPSQFTDKALTAMKSCLDKSADILKQAGADKSKAMCKFAYTTARCFHEQQETICKGK